MTCVWHSFFSAAERWECVGVSVVVSGTKYRNAQKKTIGSDLLIFHQSHLPRNTHCMRKKMWKAAKFRDHFQVTSGSLLAPWMFWNNAPLTFEPYAPCLLKAILSSIGGQSSFWQPEIFNEIRDWGHAAAIWSAPQIYALLTSLSFKLRAKGEKKQFAWMKRVLLNRVLHLNMPTESYNSSGLKKRGASPTRLCYSIMTFENNFCIS